MKICPECKYERTAQDDHLCPDYECPSCGIILEKDKAQKALAELEKKREEERKAKRQKLRKEEERQQREEEDRRKKEEKKRDEREEEEKKRKAELERKVKGEESKRVLQKRQEEISNLAREHTDKIITSEEDSDEYQLFDMCPFVLKQTGKGLAIAGIGAKNNSQHLRCIQEYCRLWTLKVEGNGEVYAQGCVMQFQGLTKEEIVRNFKIKNTQIIENAHPLDEDSETGETTE